LEGVVVRFVFFNIPAQTGASAWFSILTGALPWAGRQSAKNAAEKSAWLHLFPPSFQETCLRTFSRCSAQGAWPA